MRFKNWYLGCAHVFFATEPGVYPWEHFGIEKKVRKTSKKTSKILPAFAKVSHLLRKLIFFQTHENSLS